MLLKRETEGATIFSCPSCVAHMRGWGWEGLRGRSLSELLLGFCTRRAQLQHSQYAPVCVWDDTVNHRCLLHRLVSASYTGLFDMLFCILFTHRVHPAAIYINIFLDIIPSHSLNICMAQECPPLLNAHCQASPINTPVKEAETIAYLPVIFSRQLR